MSEETELPPPQGWSVKDPNFDAIMRFTRKEHLEPNKQLSPMPSSLVVKMGEIWKTYTSMSRVYQPRTDKTVRLETSYNNFTSEWQKLSERVDKQLLLELGPNAVKIDNKYNFLMQLKLAPSLEAQQKEDCPRRWLPVRYYTVIDPEQEDRVACWMLILDPMEETMPPLKSMWFRTDEYNLSIDVEKIRSELIATLLRYKYLI